MPVLSTLWAEGLVDATEPTMDARGFFRTAQRLKDHGLKPPPRGRVEAFLASSVVPLEERATRRQGTHKRYSFAHLVDLLAQPVDNFLEQSWGGGEPLCPRTIESNLDLLSEELSATMPSCRDDMDMSQWYAYLESIILEWTRARPSLEFLEEVFGTLVPFALPATRATAHTVMASKAAAERILGTTLGTQARRRALQALADVPVPALAEHDLLEGMRQDLAKAHATLWAMRAAQPGRTDPDEAIEAPTKKRSRTESNLRILEKEKTNQIRFALANRQALARLPQTLQDAARLLGQGEVPDAINEFISQCVVGRHSLARHLLLLDMALDRFIAAEIAERRLLGRFLGAAFATDESPPEQPRFAGMRFQVTTLYLAFLEDPSGWEFADTPPVRTLNVLADITHCPGKRGEDLVQVLEKQLGRFGLSRADVVAGTTDGGGENEGRAGIHALLEASSPAYVRRRCLPHIAWRTADAAIAAATDIVADYKTLAAYMADGVTWRRLRSIGCSSLEDGGCAMFKDGDRECKRLFGKAPSAIIATRPQTDVAFLRLLRGRERSWLLLCQKDLEQRALASSTRHAVERLASAERNVRRSILCEILERCLFLMDWTSTHGPLAGVRSFESLLEEAADRIHDLAITPEVIQRFELTEETLQERGWAPTSWVELACLVLLEDSVLCAGLLPDALDFHRSVADKAGGHLALVAQNVMRSHWLAAATLDRNAAQAQAAARTLVKKILTTAPETRTPFETHMFLEYPVWEALVDFSEARPPVCLWRGRRCFEPLFRLLASQFLCSPDHVLDCERAHARWQWLCATKRGLKLPAMNATLRLTHFLEQNSMDFPPHEALEEHFAAARAELRWHQAAVEDDEDIEKGWRQEILWASRFNLDPDSAALIEGPRAPELPPAGSPYERTWRSYVRQVFQRGKWYAWATRPATLVYIMENKVLAGREERSEADAVGRHLVVVFYEPLDGEASVVRRVARETEGVKPSLLTVPELMLTCGIALPHKPGRTPAEQELELEDIFPTLELLRFRGVLETEASESHVYTLISEGHAEDAFLRETPFEALTKVALARALERCHATAEPRRTVWGMSHEALRALALPHLRPPPKLEAAPKPAEALPPRARGRGRDGGRAARGRGSKSGRGG